MNSITTNEPIEKDCKLVAGDIYKRKNEHFMLFEEDSEWVLGCLDDGMRWNDPESKEELIKTLLSDDFKIINYPITITRSVDK